MQWELLEEIDRIAGDEIFGQGGRHGAMERRLKSLSGQSLNQYAYWQLQCVPKRNGKQGKTKKLKSKPRGLVLLLECERHRIRVRYAYGDKRLTLCHDYKRSIRQISRYGNYCPDEKFGKELAEWLDYGCSLLSVLLHSLNQYLFLNQLLLNLLFPNPLFPNLKFLQSLQRNAKYN